MNIETAAALGLTALVTSISPGPSNLLLLAAATNFGFRRALPQVFGVTAGFSSMLVASGLGLAGLVTAAPALDLAIRFAGGVYLLFLAWKLALAAPSASRAPEARLIGFWESAAFQWTNPKAWIVALATMSIYTTPLAPTASALVATMLFAAVNLPAVSMWAACGSGLRRFLAHPVRMRWFNRAMAILLAASVVPLIA
jgi:threonine/homoserine/homoserine lactone efflux protein